MKRSLSIIILLLTAFHAFSQKINVEVAIDSVQMLVGNQTELRLGVTVKEGQQVKFPVFEPSAEITPGVEVLGNLGADTEKVDNEFIRITSHYLLTSFEDTIYCIPSLPVIVDNKKYGSNTVGLKIITIPVDTLHPNQFFPPKDVQDNPFMWSEWSKLFWMICAALLLYVIVVLMYYRLKSNKPIVLKIRIIKHIPAHQKALNSIEKIKAHKDTVSEDDVKEYYTQLTDTLRRYMNDRFGFNAMEMTSSEIIARLKQEKDQQKINELTELFETADLVKFAKLKTQISENDRNLVSAVDFINTTKIEGQQTEERIKPTATEEQKQTMRARISLKWGIIVSLIIATALLTYAVWQIISLLS